MKEAVQHQTLTLKQCGSACGTATHAAVEEIRKSKFRTANSNNDTDNCWNCGYQKHSKEKCPAREAQCRNCGKTGHYAKVCKSKGKSTSTKKTLKEVHEEKKDKSLANADIAYLGVVKDAFLQKKIHGILH